MIYYNMILCNATCYTITRYDITVLCHLYPYPCPKKLCKLPAALFCYTNLFYRLAWAWAWV